jgi:epoxyqueuosine reductase
MHPTPSELTQFLKARAKTLGFARVHVIPAQAAPNYAFFKRWLALGRAGEMAYLERGAEARANPATLAPELGVLQSMVMLIVDFAPSEPDPLWLRDPSRGRIARYAWRLDYHDWIRERLIDLDAGVRRLSGRTKPARVFVDAGPVLERDFAALSGLSFFGKNCMSIVPKLGSHCFLATMSLPEALVYDPMVKLPSLEVDQVASGLPLAIRLEAQTLHYQGTPRVGTCGACTRCLSDCPTHAFVGPFHLDPKRCISYWTIEAKTLAPRALRTGFGNWIFGCDVCQDVCPWNHGKPETGERKLPAINPAVNPAWVAPPLLEGFAEQEPYWLDDEAFAKRFKGSPMKRAKRAGMLRNVCVALANWGADVAIAPLLKVLLEPQPVARAAACYALKHLATRHSRHDIHRHLSAFRTREENPEVLAECATDSECSETPSPKEPSTK